MAEQPWVEDHELSGVIALLSTAVAGQPHAHGGVIGSTGVGANCAEIFENEVFAVRDFCWCEGGFHPETVPDDESTPDEAWDRAMQASGGTSTGCPTNFEHFASGIRGTWYKHLGRDDRFSRVAEPGEALDVLLDCLASIGHERRRDWKSRP